jgi:RHS repeat-associated protein
LIRYDDVCRGTSISYIGRETDAEHNLGAFGARLYSSEYGRFLVVDKLWEKYRSLQGYQYSLNNPVMNFDFTGLDSNQTVTAGPGKATTVDKGKHKQTTPASTTTTSGSTTQTSSTGKKVEVVAGAVGTANAAQQGMMNVATAGKDATDLGAGVTGYQGALRTIGKVTGFLTLGANMVELVSKGSRGEPIQGALLKTAVSIGMLCVRVNPFVVIGLGIADATGVTDKYIYEPLDSPKPQSVERKK